MNELLISSNQSINQSLYSSRNDALKQMLTDAS